MNWVSIWSISPNSVLSPWDSSGQVADHQIRCVYERVGTLIRPHVYRLGDRSGLLPIFEPDLNLLGSCDHQMLQLVQRLDPLLTSRTAGHHQHSYLFYRTVPSFRDHRRFPMESNPSRSQGISRISLTDLAAFLAVRPFHFDHNDLLIAEEPG